MDDGGARGAPSARWMRVSGGLASLLVAACYVATMPLFAMVGAPPDGVAARLEYHATGTTAWAGIVALSILSDLLLVPVAVALYAVLRRWNRPAMQIATAFVLLFVGLDLAVLWPAKVSMIRLGELYATATFEQQASLMAAAGYPAAVLDSALTGVYSILTLGVGILVASIVTLRAGLGRTTALVGIATGAMSIASVVESSVTGAFPVLVVGTSLLTIVWFVLTGLGLLRWQTTRAP
jgi:hypothetical protein